MAKSVSLVIDVEALVNRIMVMTLSSPLRTSGIQLKLLIAR